MSDQKQLDISFLKGYIGTIMYLAQIDTRESKSTTRSPQFYAERLVGMGFHRGAELPEGEPHGAP